MPRFYGHGTDPVEDGQRNPLQWPSDYEPEILRCRLWTSVTKIVALETDTPDSNRTIAATIYPPAA